MSAIYLHIPFCKQICHYCNFYATASTKYRKGFVEALLQEMDLRHDYLEDKTISSIYFGGGTPSLLSTTDINALIDKIQHSYDVADDVEITLEGNPDDLTEDPIKALKNETPINRLSMGVQSFFSDDLQYLNRVHDGKQARQSIEFALKHGLFHMTIDLIYGIPTLTEEKWLENLEIFFSYGLPHLSSYALTVEPKTALDVLIAKKKMAAVDENQSIRHFEMLLEQTKAHNYIHYEISNFALSDQYSRHNSMYWLGGHYVGFGPSAHSYNGYSRQWNVSNMKAYMEADIAEKVVAEKEVLSKNQTYNEYVMTSLRTSWGCDMVHVNHVFGSAYVKHFESHIHSFVEEGKCRKEGNTYLLTDYGKRFADGIAGEVFLNVEG